MLCIPRTRVPFMDLGARRKQAYAVQRPSGGGRGDMSLPAPDGSPTLQAEHRRLDGPILRPCVGRGDWAHTRMLAARWCCK